MKAGLRWPLPYNTVWVWVAASRPTAHAICFGEFYKKKTEPVKGFFVLSFLRPREKASESVFVYSHPGDVSDLTAHSYKRGRTPSPLSGSLPLSVLPSLLFLQQIGLHLGHKRSLAVWLEINNSNEDNLLKSRVQYRSFSICLRSAKHSEQNEAAAALNRALGKDFDWKQECACIRSWIFKMNKGHESLPATQTYYAAQELVSIRLLSVISALLHLLIPNSHPLTSDPPSHDGEGQKMLSLKRLKSAHLFRTAARANCPLPH